MHIYAINTFLVLITNLKKKRQIFNEAKHFAHLHILLESKLYKRKRKWQNDFEQTFCFA